MRQQPPDPGKPDESAASIRGSIVVSLLLVGVPVAASYPVLTAAAAAGAVGASLFQRGCQRVAEMLRSGETRDSRRRSGTAPGSRGRQATRTGGRSGRAYRGRR